VTRLCPIRLGQASVPHNDARDELRTALPFGPLTGRRGKSYDIRFEYDGSCGTEATLVWNRKIAVCSLPGSHLFSAWPKHGASQFPSRPTDAPERLGRTVDLGRPRLQQTEDMAERVGFEPTIPVKVCPLSRRIVSTAHAPLRVGHYRILGRFLPRNVFGPSRGSGFRPSTSLRTGSAGSRCAHARKTAQFQPLTHLSEKQLSVASGRWPVKS
jgi:hypothetical protein